jgi:5-methylcytosine-specific restriction endonuclease McrA
VSGPIAPTSRLRYQASVPYSDPEKRRAYGREWMKLNADKAREAMRRWRMRHPNERKAEGRAYYARDPERRQHQIDGSPNRNAVRRAMHERRRARALEAAGDYSFVEWLELVAAHRGRCAYCGIEGQLDADHRVPLSRGGSNSIDNILPSCRSCNLHKHALTEAEFRARLAAERSKRRPYH